MSQSVAEQSRPDGRRWSLHIAGAILLFVTCIGCGAHASRDEAQAPVAGATPQADDAGAEATRKALELTKSGQRDEALTLFRQALAAREQQAREHPKTSHYLDAVAASHVDLGLALSESQKFADADRSLQKARQLREQLVKDHAEVASYRVGLGACYADLALNFQRAARTIDAAAMHREAIEIREQLAQQDATNSAWQHDLANSYIDLAIIEREQGKLDSSISLCRQAAAIHQRLVEQDPTADRRMWLAWDDANLGVALLISGQASAAVDACARAVASREQLVAEFPDNVAYQGPLAWGYANLGAAQLSAGQTAAAVATHRKALRIRVKLHEDDPQQLATTLEVAASCRDLGNAEREQRHFREAAIFFQAAVTVGERLAIDAPDNDAIRSNQANDLAGLGDCLALQGDWDASATAYTRAAVMSEFAWRMLFRAALAQTAAGDPISYRASCADLLSRYSASTDPELLLNLALTLLADPAVVADTGRAQSIARRAAAANPHNNSGSLLVAMADVRANANEASQAALAQAIHTSTATIEPDKDERSLAIRAIAAALLASKLAKRHEAEKSTEPTNAAQGPSVTANPSPRDTNSDFPSWGLAWSSLVADRFLQRSSSAASGAKTDATDAK